MTATQDLISAALRLTALAERNTDDRDEWQHSISEVREMCARAMVQPDMAEVEKRLCIHENVVRMHANGAEFDKAPSATRAALLEYVRGIMAERDALIHDNKRLMQIAAQEVSAAPQPVGEFCTDYHCPGDCGLNGHGYQHAPQPVSAAEVPMPDAIGRLYFGGVSCGERDEWEFDADQGVCDGINESATEESRQRVYLHRDVLAYGDARESAGYARGLRDAIPTGHWVAPMEPTALMESAGLDVLVGEDPLVFTWGEAAAIYREMRDAALRGEVK